MKNSSGAICIFGSTLCRLLMVYPVPKVLAVSSRLFIGTPQGFPYFHSNFEYWSKAAIFKTLGITYAYMSSPRALLCAQHTALTWLPLSTVNSMGVWNENVLQWKQPLGEGHDLASRLVSETLFILPLNPES